MHRRSKSIIAAASVAAGVSALGISAAGANEGQGRGDLAVGSAVMAAPTPAGPGSDRLTVNARSRPAGLDPRGYVIAQGDYLPGLPPGPFRVSGAVTCLHVEGNQASIKYSFDQASGSAAALKGGGIEVFVQQNAGGVKDEAAAGPPQGPGAFQANASMCDPPNAAPYYPIESGHYTVRDDDGAVNP